VRPYWRAWARHAAQVAGLFLLTACADADYYMHLARGQADVIFHRRSLDDVLQDPSSSPATVERLNLVQDVRRFADQQIGLRGTSSNYTTYYDTGGEPIAWNVSASPPDRFEAYRWSFPLVGALPYKGYFQRQRAIIERDLLRSQGYDAIAGAVSAYSTLGYLSDPILSTMLDDSEDRLVDLVLHELTHATIYIEDHTDFNESVASFVGKVGSLKFLQQRYGEGSAQVTDTRRRRADLASFQTFLRGVTTQLDSLYGSGTPREQILTERVRLFDSSKESYRQQRDSLGGGRYDGFLDWQLNNARLLSYRRYNSNFDGLYSLLQRRQGDLALTLKSIVVCGEAEDPWSCIDNDTGD
jgi:predicted aminopeptidase